MNAAPLTAEEAARLAVAQAAPRPISDAPRVPLEVERLLSESQRRPGQTAPADDIEELIQDLRNSKP